MDEKLQRLLREAERAGYVVNFQKKSDLEHIVREWAELLVMRRQMQTLEAFCARSNGSVEIESMIGHIDKTLEKMETRYRKRFRAVNEMCVDKKYFGAGLCCEYCDFPGRAFFLAGFKSRPCRRVWEERDHPMSRALLDYPAPRVLKAETFGIQEDSVGPIDMTALPEIDTQGHYGFQDSHIEWLEETLQCVGIIEVIEDR